jgi:hypothetical protein
MSRPEGGKKLIQMGLRRSYSYSMILRGTKGAQAQTLSPIRENLLYL